MKEDSLVIEISTGCLLGIAGCTAHAFGLIALGCAFYTIAVALFVYCIYKDMKSNSINFSWNLNS